MTNDFAEDFIEACEKEREPYLIVYRTSNGGCRVRWNTDNWENGMESEDWTKEEDILSAIQYALENSQ